MDSAVCDNPPPPAIFPSPPSALGAYSLLLQFKTTHINGFHLQVEVSQILPCFPRVGKSQPDPHNLQYPVGKRLHPEQMLFKVRSGRSCFPLLPTLFFGQKKTTVYAQPSGWDPILNEASCGNPPLFLPLSGDFSSLPFSNYLEGKWQLPLVAVALPPF